MLQGGGGSSIGGNRVADEAALPDLNAQVAFCLQAERYGIESVLVDMNYGKPDPMVFGLVLARATNRLKFMIAHRPGLLSPTLFVQQVNTFSSLTNGRISLNIVAGHSPHEQRFYGDHHDHDGRYLRMDEFLTICREFWNSRDPVNFRGTFYHIEEGRLNTPYVSDRSAQPEIFLGGSSPQAEALAAKHATCWMRFGDSPDRLRDQIAPVLAAGKEVGLRLSVIARSTRREALDAAAALLAGAPAAVRSDNERRFVEASDAKSMQQTYQLAQEEWPAPALWTGGVRVFGATALALVGDASSVAEGIMAFADAGVSQFILSGWPNPQELQRFGDDVLPRVRELERKSQVISPESRSESSQPVS
jgi:alkanesulfonate monooxygenase